MASVYDPMAQQAMISPMMVPPMAPAANEDEPQVHFNPVEMTMLAQFYNGIFDRYKSERMPAELRWLRNLRQYLGIYDAEIETQLPTNRSRAYPRMTRTKCLQLLSRVMNLMFPGNDKNWTITASPSPSMDPEAVATAVADLISQMQQAGMDTQLTQDLIDTAVKRLADTQAKALSKLIEDQLDELGTAGDGAGKLDWIALNRKVLDSGIKYGIGVLEGPFVRAVEEHGWVLTAPTNSPVVQPTAGGYQPVKRTVYKPHFEFLPCWDFYPDMTARELPGEGYFVRKIFSSHKLKKLRKRTDFIAENITELLQKEPNGNYKTQFWETELRAMGVAINADRNSNVTANRHRYEVIIWRGPVDAGTLQRVGMTIEDDAKADDIFVELWMCAGTVIKLVTDPWKEFGEHIQSVHVFNFDEDDTSPISQGLPYVMRDSQMSVCAATRMTLDNASVVCGPNLEVNRALLAQDTDLGSVTAYKVWVREDDGPTSQFPAVRQIQIDGHLGELQGLITLFERFAESETFLGSSTGGDLANMPSEPMRTAAGASMVNSTVALPFKDVVRNYDTFTQSTLTSLVGFNRALNKDLMSPGDYTVVARGATSLVAKEVRGNALDTMAQTLQPEDQMHVDRRKFLEARFAARDLEDMLRPEHEVEMAQAQQGQQAQQAQDLATRAQEAEIGKTQAEAYKTATQGQKNVAGAQNSQVKSALDLAEAGNAANQNATGGEAGAVPAGQSVQ